MCTKILGERMQEREREIFTAEWQLEQFQMRLKKNLLSTFENNLTTCNCILRSEANLASIIFVTSLNN